MINFVVIDSAGAILRTGAVQTGPVEAQAMAGETAIETDGTISSARHYWTGAGWADIPPEPENADRFDHANGVWLVKSAQTLASEQLAADRTAALRYLADTDWYVSRLVETGTPIPAEVSAARAAARLIL